MPDSERDLILDFGHGLNLARAEDTLTRLAELSVLPASIVVDLRKCRHVDVGAAWRFGNALRLLRQTKDLRVLLPDFGLQPPKLFDHSKWFSLLTHSGLGNSIARSASEIHSGDQDITQELREYYANPRATPPLPIHAWASSTFIYVPDLLRGDLSPDDPADFNLRFRELLTRSQLDVRAYPHRAVAALFQLLFEALQNVWDHAGKAPLPPGTEIASSLAVRYFKIITPPKALTGEFNAFLSRTADTDGFIETVVVDDGVGVAARHSQSDNVYHGSFATEVSATAEAFRSGSSVKLRVEDTSLRGSPGYGFTKILDGLRALRAFALLRTGRVLCFYDSTLEDETFSQLAHPLGYMPGTALQVVFPRKLARVWSVADAD